MSAAADDGVLAARGICKSFPGVRALDNVSIELRPGRLVALVGENGAGKSTLMSILAGVVAPDKGVVSVGGQEVRFKNTRDARAAGINAIFQELSLAPNLTVAENIFLGREPRTAFGTIDYRKMHRDAAKELARLGLDAAADCPVAALRVGQQQVVEIARALSTRARVLIMDEPTSALAPQETESLLKVVAELKRDGVAVLYITHKFEELAGVADNVAIMRDGRLVAEAAYAGITHDEIVRLMVGHKAGACDTKPRAPASKEVLRAESVSLAHDARRGQYAVRDVSLHVAAGEIVGLFGLIGAGRTELLETLFGVHGSRATGELFVDGLSVGLEAPSRAIAAGLALAPEDRKHDGLVLGMSSRENAGLASARAAARWGLLTPRSETSRVIPLLERLRLKAHSLEDPVRNLSGGNQQKVVLAKWLATSPKVLLLDEPTRGIDINAKNEIYALIRELAEDGLAVLIASSELPEVLTICDRIVVLCEGRKTGEFTRAEATAEGLLRVALPRASTSSLP
jgi:ABC-type sugar transport system ATPase subunit